MRTGLIPGLDRGRGGAPSARSRSYDHTPGKLRSLTVRLCLPLLVCVLALCAGAAHASNPQIMAGGSATFPKTGSSAPQTGTWDITLNSSSVANSSSPSGWSVSYSYSTSNFTVTAPSSATVATNYLVRYVGMQGPASANFDVIAATLAISSVSVNPTSVIGGTNSTGTVTLTVAAPSGGTVVTLSSNNAAATVPASVTVAQGQTSATFTVTTTTVTSSTAVTLTGSYNSVNKTCTLTVVPQPALSSLTLLPAGPEGGSNSTGTVTLTSAAPSAGVVITLASSNTAVATVPASVTVTSGNTSATFTVTTKPVLNQTTLTISATYNGNTLNATLNVYPPNLTGLTLSPSSTTGGQNVTGTLTLDGPAPSGATVTVSCDTPGAVWINGSAPPQNVALTANATTTSFTIVTSTVNYPVTVNLSAVFQGGLTQTASLTLNPTYLHATDIFLPTDIHLAWNSTATGNFLLYRAPVNNGVIGTLTLLATLPNTTFAYDDTTGFTSGQTYYYKLVDSNNSAGILSDEEVVPYQTGASDDQAVDSRIDPRYSTNVFLDFCFGSTAYRGGLFVGYASDPAKTGRSYARFPLGAAPTGVDFRTGNINAYFCGAVTSGSTSVTVQVGCQAVSNNTWSGSTMVWDTQPAPSGFSPANAINFQGLTYNPSSPAFGWRHWNLANDIKNSMQGSGTLSVVWTGQTDTTSGWAYLAKKEYNSGQYPPTAMSLWDYAIPITISTSPTSMTLARGQTSSQATGTVTVNGIGLGNTASVALGSSGLQGFTLNMPSTLAVDGRLSSRQFTFTVTVPTSHATGVFVLPVTATLNGVMASANLTITVQ